MAGKPSAASDAGKRFLAKFPGATAEQVARASGLTVSAVMKTQWWKLRNSAKKEQSK